MGDVSFISMHFFVCSCNNSGVLSIFWWKVSGSRSISQWWQCSCSICSYDTTVDPWTWL